MLGFIIASLLLLAADESGRMVEGEKVTRISIHPKQQEEDLPWRLLVRAEHYQVLKTCWSREPDIGSGTGRWW